jgi:hypothetical protein
MDDEMARAYERDHEDKRRIDELVRAIDAFYVSSPPPRRVKPGTLLALADVAGELGEVSAAIARTWE